MAKKRKLDPRGVGGQEWFFAGCRELGLKGRHGGMGGEQVGAAGWPSPGRAVGSGGGHIGDVYISPADDKYFTLVRVERD